jgi:thiol:disulfide interchange protein
MRLPVLGVALALVPAAVGGDNPGKDNLFQKVSYQAALKKAKAASNLVMIDFYADWCAPCKQLDAQTFRNAKVRQFLQNRTVPIRVDVDKNKKLVGKYNIQAIPCMVFVDGEGKEVGRILGFESPDNFLKKARKIVK